MTHNEYYRNIYLKRGESGYKSGMQKKKLNSIYLSNKTINPLTFQIIPQNL